MRARECSACSHDPAGICQYHEQMAERLAEEAAGAWGEDW